MKKQINRKKARAVFLLAVTVLILGMCVGCGQKAGKITDTGAVEHRESAVKLQDTGEEGGEAGHVSWSGLAPTDTLDLKYASQFSVTYYGEEKYALVTIGEDEKFLVVPEEEQVPEDIPADVTPLPRPLNNMYLAATSAMDFFCHLDAVDQITLSGTDSFGWYLEEPKKALE